MKKALIIIGACLTTFVYLPIWYYLLYKILLMINATELMWFLFWIYIPVGLFVGIISKITEMAAKEGD